MQSTDDAAHARQRAWALLEVGRAQDALVHAQRALSAAPSSARALTLVAHVFQRLGRYADARDYARRALAHDPQDVEALSALAAAHAGCGDLDAADEASRDAIAAAPHLAGLHLQSARIRSAAKRPEEALRSAEVAQRLDPANAEVYVVLAPIYTDLRRHDEARLAADRAVQLDPGSADSHQVAGFVGLRRPDSDAVARFRDSLRLDPTDQASQHGMEVALRSRNPVYGVLLRSGLWLNEQSPATRWAVRLAPFILARIANALHSTALLVLVAVAFVLIWAIEPLTSLSLLAVPADRRYVSARARRSALVFSVLAALAVAGFVVAETAPLSELIPLVFGIALFALASGSGHRLTVRDERIVHLGAGAAVALSVAAAALAVATGHANGAASGVTVLLNAAVFLGGIASLWFVALK